MFETFSERVKWLRKENNLTLVEMGDRLGIGRDAYANLEYGRVEPAKIVLKAICRETGASLDWLESGAAKPYTSDEDRVVAKVVSLMAGSEHKNTKALIRALAKLDDAQLDAIDTYVDALLAELGR